jgi:hypothetical protein
MVQAPSKEQKEYYFIGQVHMKEQRTIYVDTNININI